MCLLFYLSWRLSLLNNAWVFPGQAYHENAPTCNEDSGCGILCWLENAPLLLASFYLSRTHRKQLMDRIECLFWVGSVDSFYNNEWKTQVFLLFLLLSSFSSARPPFGFNLFSQRDRIFYFLPHPPPHETKQKHKDHSTFMQLYKVGKCFRLHPSIPLMCPATLCR